VIFSKQSAEPRQPPSQNPSRAQGKEKSGRDTEGLFYALSCYWFRIWLTLFFRYRIFHSERVPRHGAAILASNHASFLDPVAIGCGVPRPCAFLARDSLFRVPLLGRSIRSLNAHPVPRQSGSPRRALQLTLEILRQGRLLVLFPEGTRTTDGTLSKLRKGIGWIAKRSGAPVVPVRVDGSFEAWPRGRRWPRPFPVSVFYGEPLYYSAEESEDVFLERLRNAMERLGHADPAAESSVSNRAGNRPGSGSDEVTSHSFVGPQSRSPRPRLHRDYFIACFARASHVLRT